MCAACGVPTHIPVLDPAPAEAPARSVKFAALRNRSCRPYLGGAALAMMADNVEHVITYWVIWQKFHSPALTGFEVISHWLPFLLLSPYFGALADRYDCRKLIQASQALGQTHFRILWWHLLPNLSGLIVVYLTLTVPAVMLDESFMSFLGVGVPAPLASWGTLVSNAASVINPLKPYWWLLVFPGAFMSLTLLSLNFLGDGLRDALDPRSKK